MSKLLIRVRADMEKAVKELRELIDAHSVEIAAIHALVAETGKVEDDVPEVRYKQSRIPAKPAIMDGLDKMGNRRP